MSLSVKGLDAPGYESVLWGEDSSVGLRAIIAIHSTRLGPSCGGVRLLPYFSEQEALTDVLRLAKGMSYKSAVAGLGFGGGKSVIICDPIKKTPALLERFGEFVQGLEGRYIAAKDMNINNADLMEIRKSTKHVLGLEDPESSGDPSPITAIGCLEGIRCTWERLTGSSSIQNVSVAIQGLGHVGYDLAKRIHAAGGKLIVADIDPEVLARAKTELGAVVVDNELILSQTCDILAPCARGAILNGRSIPQLHCKAIVGCANNQLETQEDGIQLWKNGILYAPDFVVNAGGIINIFVEFEGYNRERAVLRSKGIYQTLKKIYVRASQENIPPFIIADKLAEERLK